MLKKYVSPDFAKYAEQDFIVKCDFTLLGVVFEHEIEALCEVNELGSIKIVNARILTRDGEIDLSSDVLKDIYQNLEQKIINEHKSEIRSLAKFAA